MKAKEVYAIEVIASGSSGNMTNYGEYTIDVGVKGDVQKNLLITHAHGDHIKYLDKAIGVCKRWWTHPDVYDSIIERLNKKGKIHATEAIKKYEQPTGVKAHLVNHDLPCCAFEFDDYLHVSDTGSIELEVEEKEMVTVESNYSYLKLLNTARPPMLIDRITNTHLENEEAIAFAHKHVKEGGHVTFVHMSKEANSLMIARATHAVWLENNGTKHFTIDYK